jgi:hypothetical protein
MVGQRNTKDHECLDDFGRKLSEDVCSIADAEQGQRKPPCPSSVGTYHALKS